MDPAYSSKSLVGLILDHPDCSGVKILWTSAQVLFSMTGTSPNTFSEGEET